MGTISDNFIYSNEVEIGGGIYIVPGGESNQAVVCNNLIKGNTVDDYGAGIMIDDSPYFTSRSYDIIVNNTIVANYSDIECYGSGIMLDSTLYYFYTTVANNIVTGNDVGITVAMLDPGLWKGTVAYNDFWNNECSDYEGIQPGVGDIHEDPMFVDAENDNYYLQAGSPCLSIANCEWAPETDKDGHTRPIGSGCDMGCYEECDEGLIYGDISWNCNVTAFDASLALKYVVGLIDLSQGQKLVADVTGNGTITALDAAYILQYTVGLIIRFPVSIQKAAPVLNTKIETQLLAKAIKQLETVPLDREQHQVLEQLKRLSFNQLLPNYTTLLQNFPNPFNPETWLPYQLASEGFVTIRIYNTKGQLIRTLNLGNQPAGMYITKDKAAYWDGRDNFGEKVASGVYFYTLQAGKFKATRRLVVMK